MSPPKVKPPDDTPTDSVQSNVVAFQPRRRQEPAEPLFTDAERVELRAMLREFQAIKQSCPMARRLLREDE